MVKKKVNKRLSKKDIKQKKKRLFYLTLAILLTILIGISIYFLVLKESLEKERDCDTYSVDECPARCVVCPPCQLCNSISCRTEQFCKSIGFDRRWYEVIKTKLPQ